MRLGVACVGVLNGKALAAAVVRREAQATTVTFDDALADPVLGDRVLCVRTLLVGDR